MKLVCLQCTISAGVYSTVYRERERERMSKRAERGTETLRAPCVSIMRMRVYCGPRNTLTLSTSSPVINLCISTVVFSAELSRAHDFTLRDPLLGILAHIYIPVC